MTDLAVQPSGYFCGYASLFSATDLGRDRVEPGAFTRALQDKTAAGIKMLYQHDPSTLIGHWITIQENRRGLWVEGKLNLANRLARQVYRGLASRRIDGLSIGFRARKAAQNPISAVRRLIEIDLWEISVVTDPMLPQARVTGVKSRCVHRSSANWIGR